MKNQLLSLACVVVFGSSSVAWAETQIDRFRTDDGAACEQSYNTGRHFEFGVEANDGWGHMDDDVRVFAKWVFELGRDKVDARRINCQRMIHLEQHRMEMKNQRMRLELELLQLQVEAARNNQHLSTAPVADGDDW